MQKKYSNMRLVLHGFLVMLAVSVALISCGDGDVIKQSEVDDYDDLNFDITGSGYRGIISACFVEKFPGSKVDCDKLLAAYCEKTGDCPVSGGEESSSSEEEPSSDSEESSSSEEPLSSSEEPSSSSEVLPSSSSEEPPPPSSSSDFTVFLTCEDLPKTGNRNEMVVPFPIVKCGETVLSGSEANNYTSKNSSGEEKPSNLLFTDNGIYEIFIQAECDGGSQKVSCNKINIGGVKDLKCGPIAAGTKIELGETITKPAVTCNGEPVEDGSLVWGNLTPTELGPFEVNVAAGSGDCEDATAECGFVEVEDNTTPSSSSDGGEDSSSSSEDGDSSSSSDDEPGLSSSSSSSQGSSSSDGPITPVTVTCAVVEGTPGSGTCYNIPRPSIICSDASAAGTATFTVSGGSGTVPTEWTSPGGIGSFCNPGIRTVSLTAVKCGSADATSLPIECGSFTIPEAQNPLTCTDLVETGTQGVQFAAPTVTCNGTPVTTGLTWTPANRTPTTTGSVAVSVTNNCGGSSRTAQCGNITVSPATFSCAFATGTTGVVGTPVTPPTVTCNGTAVTTGLTWTPSLTPTAPGDFTVSVTVGSGYCASTTARTCGSVEVTAPGGCGYQPSYCNNLYEKAEDVPKTIPPTSSASSSGTCYFVKTITEFCANDKSNTSVNGTKGIQDVGCNNGNASLPTKIDDGYYIYLPAYQLMGKFAGTAGGPPVCSD